MSFALAREKAAVFSDWLLHATVAAHESGHFLNAFQRKGRLAQGLHGDGHQLHRVVVRRHTVGTESAAALAAVDDGPFAVFRTQTAMGSMIPPQSEARSPGSMSTCRLERQLGQWLRWSLPAFSGVQSRPQTLQVKLSWQAWVL